MAPDIHTGGEDISGSLRRTVEAMIASGAASAGAGAAPAEGLYFREGEGVYLGGVKIADLSGTPADGSVSYAKLATSAVRKLCAPWRLRKALSGALTNAAVANEKYSFEGNTVNSTKAEVKTAASATAASRIDWVAADEFVEGLVTKCKIKAKAFFGTSPKTTLRIGLWKMTVNGEGKRVPTGEEIAGFNLELPEAAPANTPISGSVEFEMPKEADGDYEVLMSPNSAVAQNFTCYADLLVANR